MILEDSGRRCWHNRSSNPQRIRALDPELAHGFDAIANEDWSFGKLVEMGLLPSSSFMVRSTTPRWAVQEVSEQVWCDHTEERNEWLSSLMAMMPREPFDLLVVEPGAQIIERVAHHSRCVYWDELANFWVKGHTLLIYQYIEDLPSSATGCGSARSVSSKSHPTASCSTR